jgi:hypothetical protein
MAFGLDAWTFDATLEAFGGGEPEAECGGHGQLHGDHCHCDPGYRLDPQNPRNCIPQ